MVDLGTCAAIVLAAGQSKRFGAYNKLTTPLDGKLLLAHCLETVCGLGLQQVLVVTGHEADAIAAIAADFPVQTVHNADFAAGMGGSIAVGAEALRSDAEAVFVVLGDMPYVRADDYAALARALPGPDAICRPVHDGQPGLPVLFGANFVPALTALSGEAGAREILAHHPQSVQIVTTVSLGVVRDFDSQEDWPER